MATPQLEDGFTRIANEILEAIITSPFNATQQKIILLLLRRSYGFNRKSCQLSISFIEKATGLSGRGIRTELNALIKTGVIDVTCEPTFNTPRELSFQKDYSKWSVAPQENCSSTENNSSTEEAQQQSGTTVPQGVELQLHSTVEAQFHSTEELQFHQERKIKDNIKKDIKDTLSCAAEETFNRFWTAYPKKVAKEDARKAWKKIKPNQELIDKIVIAVKAQSASEQWIKDNGQFIPNPATWLNRGQWEDEIKTAASKYRTEVY